MQEPLALAIIPLLSWFLCFLARATFVFFLLSLASLVIFFSSFYIQDIRSFILSCCFVVFAVVVVVIVVAVVRFERARKSRRREQQHPL